MKNLKKNLFSILILFLLVLPSINAATCIGASVSNFTSNSTGNHTRTIIGYGNVGGCFDGKIIALPPSTGGGGSMSGTSNLTDFDKFYDVGFICNQSKSFLQEIGRNYTENEFKTFKNDLIKEMGIAIGDLVLKDFVDNFEKNCLKKTLTIGVPEPGEPTEEGFNFAFLFVLIILMAFVITLFLTHKKRKKGAIRAAIKDFFKK